MRIIVPMAGRGERFLRVGYQEPKPLIDVLGRPMIEYVTRLFPGEENFVFICNKEHLRTSRLEDVLMFLKPQGIILEIDTHKLGPVYSVLQIMEDLKDGDDEPVIVNYCDFFGQWDYTSFLSVVHEKKATGALACYRGFHPHLDGPNVYAGVLADDLGNILEVREKHSFTTCKQDTWQSAGMYFFKNISIAKRYFFELYHDGEMCNGEFFVSQVFNYMIRDDLSVILHPMEHFCQWGTPEDLSEFLIFSKVISRINNLTEPIDVRSMFEHEDLKLVRNTSDQYLEETFQYWLSFFRKNSIFSMN